MLKGICTPVCTPFHADQSLDEAAFLKHIDTMLEAGIHSIAVCGGTGEFPFLSGPERLRMAEIAIRHINGRARVVVQTSAIRTQDAVEFSRHAQDVGADVVMVLPPYFEGPDADGVFWHYEQLSAAITIPIMVYNIPVHSGFDITPEFCSRLMTLDRVEYIKDSTGDLMRVEQLVARGAKVFCGCDWLMPYALLAGATGCFWGGSNAMPREAVALYTLYSEGRLADMMTLWQTMKAANIFFWTNSYNAAVKAAVNLRGGAVGECRLPVLPLGDAKKAELAAALAQLK